MKKYSVSCTIAESSGSSFAAVTAGRRTHGREGANDLRKQQESSRLQLPHRAVPPRNRSISGMTESVDFRSRAVDRQCSVVAPPVAWDGPKEPQSARGGFTRGIAPQRFVDQTLEGLARVRLDEVPIETGFRRVLAVLCLTPAG